MENWIIIIISFIAFYFLLIFVYIIYHIYWYSTYFFNMKQLSLRDDTQPDIIKKLEYNPLSSVINNSGYVFAILSVILIIMYIIWLIITILIPEWLYPLPIPIRKILSEIPPLPELNEAGFFRLFDGIVNVFTTREKFLKKIGFTMETIGNFLSDATEYIIKNQYPEYNKENMKKYLNNYKIEDFETNSNNINNSNNNKKKTILKDELLDQEEIMIKNELDNCINKSYINITPDLNEIEKLYIKMENIKSGLKCNIETIGSKIKATNNI